MKKRVLINMEGGLIQSITANFKGLEIAIMDYDLPETEPLEDIDVDISEPSCIINTETFSDNLEVFGNLNDLAPSESHFIKCLKRQGW